jgi:hypothetical protein
MPPFSFDSWMQTDKVLTVPVSTATAVLRHDPNCPEPHSPDLTGEVNMRRILTAAASTAAIAVIVLGAAGAQAGSLGRACTAAPESQYLPASQLQSKVEALGYKVQRVKIAKACGEIYALDKNGAKVELFVDPTNGTIIGTN